MRRKFLQKILLFVLVFFLIPTFAQSKRIQDEDTETDLMILGLGIFREDYASVGGNRKSFEDSDRQLPAEFSNSTQLDVLIDGMYHGYELNGYVRYRDITYNYEPNLSFYLKIKKDLNFLSVGDHVDGAFTDTLFTRFDPEFRGGTLHLEGEHYGFELLGGVVRGEQAEEEIAADGSSGPYTLANFPAIEGSETVIIRVRDKNNPSRIIKDERQVRGKSYKIDYEDGEIKFAYPVDDTDFRGNPVYILVRYQYDDSEGGFNRYIAGSRLWVKPNEYTQLGITYLTSAPFGDDTFEGSWNRRIQVYGTDLNIKVEDTFWLGAEFAASNYPDIEDYNSYAGRLNFMWHPTEDLKIWGGYFRVEKDFVTFGNTSLSLQTVVDEVKFSNPFSFKSGSDVYDLNPDISVGLGTDEESWGIAAEYEIAMNHTLSFGYREIRDNIPYDASIPTTSSRDIYMSYRYTPVEGFNYFAGAEWLRTTDSFTPKLTDNETWRIIAGMKGDLGETKITGPVKLEAAYIMDNYRDYAYAVESEIAHYVLVRLDAKPTPNLTLYLEQDEALLSGTERSGLTGRVDTTYLGVLYRKPKFVTDVTYKYSNEEDYILGRSVSREHLLSTSFTYKPAESIATRLKFEVGIEDDMEEDPQTRFSNYLAEAEFTWDITPDLILSVLYELEYEVEITNPATDATLEDEGIIRIDYAPEGGVWAVYLEYSHERSQVRTYPLSTIESSTDNVLFGAKYNFVEDWEWLSGFKFSRSYGASDTHDIDGYTEVGYQMCQYLKFSLGYEYQEFYDHYDPVSDYQAHIGYLKITGKF